MLRQKYLLKLLHFVLVVIAVSLPLSSCTTRELKIEPIAPSEDALKQVKLLKDEIEAARQRQVDKLSPGWFRKAETSLSEASRSLQEGDELSVILKKVSLGRAQLMRAEELARVVRSALQDVIEARERALTAGAEGLGDSYAEAEKQFIALAEAIEKDKLHAAQAKKEEVVRVYDSLELHAIRKRAIGEAEAQIRQAEAENAEKLTPMTLNEAKNALRQADSFISQNRYATEEINSYGRNALFQAQRLNQILAQSKKLSEFQPEEAALWFESMLYRIEKTLSTVDIRNKEFEVQADEITMAIDKLRFRKQVIADKGREQYEEILSLREELVMSKRHERERKVGRVEPAGYADLDGRIASVMDLFGPTEAEVYVQGKWLVIRLRSIRFPVGQAQILAKNYALLGRVEKAIELFNEPEVVVEGHTDSTGNEERNMKLSLDRAEAVRAYLIAAGKLSPEKINAVAYGSSRPIASDATAEGRAINRRIDVLISFSTGGLAK